MISRGKFIIRPNGPYDFKSSFSFYRRSRFEMVDRFADRYFVRAFEFDSIPVVIKIACGEGDLDDRLVIEWSSPNQIKDRSGLRRLLRKMFYLDFDINGLYNQRLDPVIKKLTRRFIGFRPILTPTIFEAAAWAIIGQQINLQFAYKIKSNLIRHINRSFVLEGEKYYLFPRVTDIARLDFATLKKLKFSRQKATYILELAQLICDRKINLNSLSSLEFTDAIEILLEIKGIGTWTANYIMMRGMGHPDAWPIGDSGINHAVKNLYGLERKPDTDFLIALGDKWRPYRSLAAYYLWKSLSGDNHADYLSTCS